MARRYRHCHYNWEVQVTRRSTTSKTPSTGSERPNHMWSHSWCQTSQTETIRSWSSQNYDQSTKNDCCSPGNSRKRLVPKVPQSIHKINLEPDVKPHAIYTPRHVPLPLRSKVKQGMEKDIKSIRAGVQAWLWHRRRTHSTNQWDETLPTVDETLAQITGAKIFSKLDANSGFWQIPLARLLTTALINFHLVFAVCRMNEILAGLPGVDWRHIGSTQEEKVIEKAHATLRLSDFTFHILRTSDPKKKKPNTSGNILI